MQWRTADRVHLRDLAWIWNPVGIPRGPETEEEYDCVIDLAVGGALAGLAPEVLAGRLAEWCEDHFGIRVPAALTFAQGVVAWSAIKKQEPS